MFPVNGAVRLNHLEARLMAMQKEIYILQCKLSNDQHQNQNILSADISPTDEQVGIAKKPDAMHAMMPPPSRVGTCFANSQFILLASNADCSTSCACLYASRSMLVSLLVILAVNSFVEPIAFANMFN
jgi:hypothetical protein